jgi:2-polyprenyl-3-methyl-5-hydroxy-6-metoxy-1,4-benzoquinol methylase
MRDVKPKSVDVDQVRDKERLFRRYGSILDTSISPISILAVRYFEKNYGKILNSISKDGRILEIGPGSGSFTQYLLYKGYTNITVCEIANDNARALQSFFGDRVTVVNKDAIQYLETSSFDLICAAQFIEHLTYDDFIGFLERCYASLSNGGYVIFETINCANVTHGLYLRYCDYTHRMGFTPRSLKQFLMAIGDFSDFKLMEIRPPGLLDFLYCICRRIGRDSAVIGSGQSTRIRRKSPISVLSRSFSVRLSRWLSFLLLRAYEFEKIRVYTPFFAIVARKV